MQRCLSLWQLTTAYDAIEKAAVHTCQYMHTDWQDSALDEGQNKIAGPESWPRRAHAYDMDLHMYKVCHLACLYYRLLLGTEAPVMMPNGVGWFIFCVTGRLTDA